MKQMYHIFCAILTILCAIDNVQSIYERNGFQNRGNHFVDDSPKTECPPGFTGLIPYAIDCRQYISCWRGHGSIQTCSPGTLFNPNTNECDNPLKVRCQPYQGNRNQRQSPNLNQRFSQRQELTTIQCERGASGLFAHPFDCKMFLNCDHGRTFIQECGPGTLFNNVFKVCDWPHKVECGSRSLNDGDEITVDGTPSDSNADSYSRTEPYRNEYSNSNTNGHMNLYENSGHPYQSQVSGEGLLDVRMDTESRTQPSLIRNRPNPQQSFYPHQQLNENRPQFPQHNNRRQQNFPVGQQYSKDETNTLNSFSSSPVNPSSLSPSFTQSAIATDSTAQESSPKSQIVQIPSQSLFPPSLVETATQSITRTGRVDENFHNQLKTEIDDRLDWSISNGRRPIESNVDDNLLMQQKPVNENIPQQYPELNIMTSRVADDFNKFFSNSQPKPKTTTPVSTTTTEYAQTVTKVYSIYPNGFESIGSKCEENRSGLHAHPYDCSRFVSCENGKIIVLSCANGFMFNPTLKSCDMAKNVKNCLAQPPDYASMFPIQTTEMSQVIVDLPSNAGQSGLPDDSVNEIYGENDKKLGEKTKTSSTQTIQKTILNLTAFPIPDMSVLPLEYGHYPQNTYPDKQKPQYPNYSGFGSSQGGDIQPDSFESQDFDSKDRFGLEIPLAINTKSRDGKELIHNAQTTEMSIDVKTVPAGHEHVMPIYHRPTQLPTTTQPSTQSNNQIYYQPFTKPMNKLQEKEEMDYIPISDALKYLLRPYLVRNDTNTTADHMKKIEDKILDMIDDGNNSGRDKALEQDSLAQADFNENVAVKNLPESPRTTTHSDFEFISTTTQKIYYIEPTTTKPQHNIPSVAHFHPQNHNSQHHSSSDNHSNTPTYYKPGTNVPINFAGTHAQYHPGFYHNNEPLSHGPSPQLNSIHSNHHHNGHGHGHAHNYGPNYHTNAPNYVWALNQRQAESTTNPTTASAPSPINSFSNFDKPTAINRLGKSQYGEVTTCDGQFDCGIGFCIPFSQICDGRNDCGNRKDEQNCEHVNYQVRLSNDKGHKHMGRVEVKAFGRWGYVCDDKFTLNNANVLCRELGFNMGAVEVKANSFFPANSNMPTGENMFLMDEVSCLGNETSLKECDFAGWGVSDCNAEEVVGVVCKVSVMQCPPGHWLCTESEECIPMEFMCDGVKDCTDSTDESPMHCNAKIEYRLMDGTELEGRVEVKYRGVWGTVCDDDFGDKEATVFCHSLGFTGSATFIKKKYGWSTGPIWLDQVDCLGNETALDKCMHFEWNENNCNHTEDVSVRCTRGSESKSSRYISADNTLQRYTSQRQADSDYLRKIQRSSKSIPDSQNVCGRIMVTAEDDESEESLNRFRIISGTKTKRGHHPWLATVRTRGRHGGSTHWCGAVIISKMHILTAAHCLTGFTKGAYFIRLGDHHLEIREDSEIEIFIESWHIHEDFRKNQTMDNDIALILLKTPIQFTKYIQPICMPNKDTKYSPGKNCIISGWGSIQYGKSTPSFNLNAATVPLIAQDVCKRKEIYGDEIMDTMFCAGYLDHSGVDACEGDSGGPLVCSDENGVYSLYGIISWGQRCADSTKPGVYVRVAHYMDWIKEKMNLL